MARKRPMTTEELFNRINGILKEKDKLLDILDYGLATHSPVPITNYEYGLKNKLDYGENEGRNVRWTLGLRGPKRRPVWICGLNILQTG